MHKKHKSNAPSLFPAQNRNGAWFVSKLKPVLFTFGVLKFQNVTRLTIQRITNRCKR